MPCLHELQNSKLKLGIISNSDPRTIKVVESLGIVPEYVPPEQYVWSLYVPYTIPSDQRLYPAQHHNFLGCRQGKTFEGDL